MQAPATLFAAAAASLLLSGCSGVSDARMEVHEGDGERRVQFTATQFTRPGIDMSPDGASIYFDVLGEIYRVPVDGGKAGKLELGPGWKAYPRVSADGGRIAFASDRADDAGVWSARVDGVGGVHRVSGARHAQAKSLAWLGDGRVVSIHRDRREPVQYTIAVAEPGYAEKRIALDPVERTRGNGMSLVGTAGDGATVFLYQTGGAVSRANLLTGAIEPLMQPVAGMEGQVRVSADGSLVGYAFASGEKTLLGLYEPSSGRHRATACALDRSIENGSQTVPYPTYAFLSGGGGVILSRDGTFHRCEFTGETTPLVVTAEIDMALAPMAVPRLEDPGRVQIRDPALNPVRKEIVFTARGHLWKTAVRGGAVSRVTDEEREELMPAYSPDGSRLAFVTQKGDVVALRTRDLESGNETIVMKSTEVVYANPAWSPDGKRIAFVEADQQLPIGDSREGFVIRSANLETGEVIPLGPAGSLDYAAHLYPRLTWSPGGDGVWFLRARQAEGEWRVRNELVHLSHGGEATVLMRFQAVLDVVPSPSGKYVAVQDSLGISIVPLFASAAASSGRPHVVTSAELASSRRIAASGTDFVLWGGGNELLWSSQDEIFSSRDLSESERLARVSLPQSSSAVEETIVYTGARIISMADQGVIANGAIATRGSRVVYVGPTASLPEEFAVAAQVDVSGKTIIPGLIDVHLHRRPGVDDFSTFSDYELFVSAAYGVTTVYDPSIATVKSAYLTDITRDDVFGGASFQGSGQILFGGDEDVQYTPIESFADARAYIGRLAKAGTRVVKSYERNSRQERRYIAEAAREAGLGVTSHDVWELGVQLGAVQDGYTALEHSLLLHSAPVQSDVIEYLQQSGVMLTPTLSMLGMIPNVLTKRSIRDQRAQCLLEDKWTSTNALAMRRVPAGPELQDFARGLMEENAVMLEAGLPVSTGGHGDPIGLSTHWEMWALALGGAQPINALKAATVHGAAKLHLGRRIGALAEGMDADFVVLNSNPLDDIHNTTDIARVVRRGRTLQWPQGSAYPQAWPVDGGWARCQAWNLGIPAHVDGGDGSTMATDPSKTR